MKILVNAITVVAASCLAVSSLRGPGRRGAQKVTLALVRRPTSTRPISCTASMPGRTFASSTSGTTTGPGGQVRQGQLGAGGRECAENLRDKSIKVRRGHLLRDRPA